ncbi:hypothetical protein Taro_046413, partial [Colocasia esculenta]|nr:hypothetical protein [Colocasia esculenta]
MRIRALTQAALQAQLEAQAQTPIPQAHDHGGPSIMEKFKRMAPPSFKGESDPLLAESWMREIEKIFRAIRCAEDDKVTLATYMLQDGEIEQYLEEKKASQKRPTAPFQRQEKKKVAYQSPQCPVATGSRQMKDYDAILGLDWLEEHYALVDCADISTSSEEIVRSDSE